MFLAQRNGYLEAGTLDAIGAVVCLDLASVHLYECLAEVQSDAGAFNVKVAAVAALVESVKESVGLLFLQSDAGILYLDDGVLLVLAHDEGDGTAIEGILHGVGEQVGNHLVEVDAVYPYRQLAIGIVEARIFLERERDVALFCIETVERYDAVQEFLELGFLAVQMHLVLVYLSLVEYLVHQKQQALGVAVDGVDFLFAFGIRDSCLQLVERSHNQCQRRTDIVGGIDEELHLGFFQVFLAMALISVDDIQDDACCIEEECPGGSIPRVAHLDVDDG